MIFFSKIAHLPARFFKEIIHKVDKKVSILFLANFVLEIYITISTFTSVCTSVVGVGVGVVGVVGVPTLKFFLGPDKLIFLSPPRRG